MHQLQRVLDRPQEHIPAAQLPELIRPQQVEFRQPHQSIQRVEAADLRHRPPVRQLQVLHHELHVANASLASLHLTPRLPALLEQLFDLLLHVGHVGPRGFRVDFIDERLQPLQSRVADRMVPRDHPRLEERLLFPQPAMFLEVVDIRVARRNQRPRPPPRTQPHVDPVQEPRGRRLADRIDQLLPQSPVAVGPRFAYEHEVDVGAVIQLFAAELAERQDREVAGLEIQLRRRHLQRRLHQAVRQKRQLQRRALQVHQAERIASREPQQFPLLVSPQLVQLFADASGFRHRVPLFIHELRPALEVGQPLMLREPVQVLRIPQQDLREKLAPHEQPEQDFDRPRVLREIAEQPLAVRRRLDEPLQVDQRRIRRRPVRQRMQHAGDRSGKQLALDIAPRQPAQPGPRLGHI